MRMLKNFSKRQAGFLLLEAALALALAAGLATYYVREQANQLTENTAKAHGMQMAKLADAVNGYTLKYYSQIPFNTSPSYTPPAVTLEVNPGQAGTATVTVANPWRPTVEELVALELLPTGFTNTAIFGDSYRVILNKQANTLPVKGYIFTTAPVQYRGQASAQLIGKALQAIGIWGGATGMGELTPETFTTLGGSTAAVNVTTELNALGIPVVAGIMGAQVGTDVAPINLPYLRLDGTSTMTGDIQVGGNAIDLARRDAANNITDRGNIRNANEVSLLSLTTPDASTPIRVARALDMGGNSISNANEVSANGRVRAGDVYSEGRVRAGDVYSEGRVRAGDVYSDGNISTPRNIFASKVVASNILTTSTTSSHQIGEGSGATSGYQCPAGYVITGLDCTGSCGSDRMTLTCTKLALEE